MGSQNLDEEVEADAPTIVYAKLSDKIPFVDVAKLLDKVSNNATGKERKENVVKFFDAYRKFYKKEYKTLDASAQVTHGDSLYPLVRIFLPAEDRGRGAYGFKSSVLGRIFAQILGLDKNSPDGKKLLNFKDPKDAGPLAGDFAQIVYSIFERRFSANAENKGPSLTELHEMLDQLGKVRGGKDNINIEGQKRVLQNFIRKLTSIEAKWLTRILLKQIRVNMSTGQIFQCIHNQAKELYERCADLEQVCRKLNDPSVPLVVAEICLFSHCQPMLCERLNIVGEDFEKDSQGAGTSGKEKIYLPQAPFLVENKWDGERFQIHYDGKKFKYTSRKGYDFTVAFDESFTSRLKPQIISSAVSFVLDGEMMAWHKKRGAFTTKGQNIDVKTMKKDNPNHIPVFVTFDILLYNGEVLTDKPLRERIKILRENVLLPKEEVCLISEQKIVSSKEEVMNLLNEAIDNFEEGIIVKDMNSIYEPSKRSKSWLKIKPEYVEGCSPSDMDVLILGAYYSDSVVRGGHFTHFLVGVMDDSDGRGTDKIFYPLAKVGSGCLKNPDVYKLTEKLRDDLVRTEIPGVKYKGRKRPDWFIDPKKSVALELKASEIIYNDGLELKYTLRFPIIKKVRYDKPFNEVMTVSEFHRLREATSGKLAVRNDGQRKRVTRSGWHTPRKNVLDSDDEGEKPKRVKILESDDESEEPLPGPSRIIKPTKAEPSLPPEQKLFSSFKSEKAKLATMGFDLQDKKTANIHLNIFQKKLFCVYGATKWKTDLEAEIKSYGGEITQSPVDNMFAIVGEKDSLMRVAAAIKRKKWNVMNDAWIRKCIERKIECELCPDDFWFCTKEIQDQLKTTHDEYGDSYTKEVTSEELKALLTKMAYQESMEMDSVTSSNNSMSLDDIITDDADKRKISKLSFLKNMKIAFRGVVNEILAIKVQFYGGKIAKDETEKGVTHVIVTDVLSPRKKFHTSAMVVKQKWLEDSLAKKEIVDELLYMTR